MGPVDGTSEGTVPAERCISFEIEGPWAHFRRIEGNVVKQTYRTIPRTTVSGLVAAILGIGRDEYYVLFEEDSSAIAIEPTSPLRTMKMPMNTLSTADGDVTTVPGGRQRLKVGLPNPSKPRQQHNYEVLVEPSYRIDLWLADRERYRELRSTLAAGESHYVPSLGLSEHLANVSYLGEHDIDPGPSGEVAVDSIVPGRSESIVPEPGTPYDLERWPAFMEARDGGRRTTGFLSVAFQRDGESLTVSDVSTASVDGRTVLFT